MYRVIRSDHIGDKTIASLFGDPECHHCRRRGYVPVRLDYGMDEDGTEYRPCPECRANMSGDVKDILADEAERLRLRDIGRDVRHGTKELYIGFAVAGYNDGSIGT